MNARQVPLLPLSCNLSVCCYALCLVLFLGQGGTWLLDEREDGKLYLGGGGIGPLAMRIEVSSVGWACSQVATLAFGVCYAAMVCVWLVPGLFDRGILHRAAAAANGFLPGPWTSDSDYQPFGDRFRRLAGMTFLAVVAFFMCKGPLFMAHMLIRAML